MIQKIIKVGTSVAVTNPKKSLKELGFRIGDNIRVNIDSVSGTKSIMSSNKSIEARDKKIASLTIDFINRYRKDLEKLEKINNF